MTNRDNWSKVIYLQEDLETMTYRAWRNMVYYQQLILKGSVPVKGKRFQEMTFEEQEKEKGLLHGLLERAEEQLGKDVIAEMLLKLDES